VFGDDDVSTTDIAGRISIMVFKTTFGITGTASASPMDSLTVRICAFIFQDRVKSFGPVNSSMAKRAGLILTQHVVKRKDALHI
jgi:hypothetical protein